MYSDFCIISGRLPPLHQSENAHCALPCRGIGRPFQLPVSTMRWSSGSTYSSLKTQLWAMLKSNKHMSISHTCPTKSLSHQSADRLVNEDLNNEPATSLVAPCNYHQSRKTMFTVRCRYMPRTPSLNDSSILGCDKTDRAVWQTAWTCQHQRHQTNRRSAATDIISTRKSSNAITGRIRKPSVANGGNRRDVSKETRRTTSSSVVLLRLLLSPDWWW